MLGMPNVNAAKPVLAQAAKNVYDTWSRSSTIARVASSVIAGLVGIASSVAIGSKASNFLNSPKKVTVESFKSEEIIVETVTVEKVSAKNSKFQQLKQKMTACAKSVIATVKAHPYKAAALTAAAALVVGAGLKARQNGLAPSQHDVEVRNLLKLMPDENYGATETTTTSEHLLYAEALANSQAEAHQSILKGLDNSIWDNYDESILYDRPSDSIESVQPKVVPYSFFDKLDSFLSRISNSKEFKADLKNFSDSMSPESEFIPNAELSVDLSSAPKEPVATPEEAAAYAEYLSTPEAIALTQLGDSYSAPEYIAFNNRVHDLGLAQPTQFQATNSDNIGSEHIVFDHETNELMPLDLEEKFSSFEFLDKLENKFSENRQKLSNKIGDLACKAINSKAGNFGFYAFDSVLTNGEKAVKAVPKVWKGIGTPKKAVVVGAVAVASIKYALNALVKAITG